MVSVLGELARIGQAVRRLVCVLGSALMVVLALTSCGNESDGGNRGGGGTSAPSDSEDRERSHRVVLAPGDLPGFRVEQSDADGHTSTSDAYQRCSTQPLVFLDTGNPRLAKSPDFANANARLRLSSFAILLRNDDEARGAFARIRQVFEGSCLEDALRTELVQRFNAKDVLVREFDLPGVSDDHVTRRVMFTLVVEKSLAAAHFDFTYLRQGRAIAGLVVAGFSVPFPTEQRLRLTRLLAGRLAAEAGATAGPSNVAPEPSTLSPDKFPRVPNVVAMDLPRARAVMLEAGFIAIKANDGAGKGRVPSLEDASWKVRFHSPTAGSPLPHLADVVLILDVVRPGERYTPETTPCPRFVQC